MKLNFFNFKKLGNKVLMTNDFGNYILVTEEEFRQVIKKEVTHESELWTRLDSAKMIYEGNDLEYSLNNMYELRKHKEYIASATALHIFVVTTACNLRCVYCQANNGRTMPHLYMSKEIAERAVDIALQSPARSLDFEFQGGEPLLNMDVIKHIVEYTEENKGNHEVKYNIVTNLTLLTDGILDFLAEHQFGISTSLDGNEALHNGNRPYPDGHGSYKDVIASIDNIRSRGIHAGAIETTTSRNLRAPEDIVNAYADQGFESIFLRPLTPLGKAFAGWGSIGYTPEEFTSFYKRALDEIIRLNKKGCYIKESHAEIFLNRISGEAVNYMELRSPCGAGIGQLAYYSDGNVFTCDEGRMFYEMGNSTFKLGNVFENTYNEIVNNGVCKTVCASSILETLPSCCDCVYQPYCGTCPVISYALVDDVMEKTPHGYKCRIYSGMLDYIFEKLTGDDKEIIRIMESWIK